MTARKLFLTILLFITALIILGVVFIFLLFHFESWQKFTAGEIMDSIIKKTDNVSLTKGLLGFEKPQTYLVLFLNNTEMRPGGGFIGAYAVIKIKNAVPELVKIEGTEILDNNAPSDFVVPPEPIKKYLNVGRWYFRDSNWSPDFSISAAKSLELYKKENGVLSDQITAVIGFTPTAVENLLAITGPVVLDGQEYDATNFTEKLEYEVEYGFAQKGIQFDDRKNILKDLAKALSVGAVKNIFKHWPAYCALGKKMLEEKQIMFYSTDAVVQQKLSGQSWTGEMNDDSSDYILWADANMGSLKTDVAVDKELIYEFEPAADGRYLARATMKYVHHGEFDWRVSRYRDYARVYVPLGSQLAGSRGAMVKEKSSEVGLVDTGTENGRQWFGAFIAIEPGQTRELIFEYYLAPQIVELIKNNNYKLIVQKQLGSTDNKLTLGLNFDKKLTFAAPGEKPENQGDGRYNYTTVLTTDMGVEILTGL